jgi:putative membrane protein
MRDRLEECSMPAHFLATLPNFLAYLGTALTLLAAFVTIYLYVTPYDEVALIRSNNMAAAVSLSGAILGFALPIANVIAHSDTLLDLAVWGAIAGIVQLLAWGVARVALPQLQEDIAAGRAAPATFVAALSLTVGLLNAACMTY